MRIGERLGDLYRKFDGAARVHRAATNFLAKGNPGCELVHEITLPVLVEILASIKESGDIRVRQRGRGACVGQERLARGLVTLERVRQNLQRDRPAGFSVASPVDFPEAAFSDALQQVVVGNRAIHVCGRILYCSTLGVRPASFVPKRCANIRLTMAGHVPGSNAAGLIHVEDLMDDVRRRVRDELRRELLARTSAPELDDEAIFAAVEQAFRSAITRARRGALILPEVIDDDDWRLETSLAWSSHRPVIGSAILLVKQRVLLPLTQWLYDYTRRNFERQQRVTETVFGCLQVLAADNARLRRDLDALQRERESRPAE
jgi:hypothetical protein